VWECDVPDLISFDPNNNECVVLRGVSVPLASNVAAVFISDVARNSEGILSGGQIREKYGLTIEAWRQLVENKAFVQAVTAERERRVRSGTAAQEAAAKLFADAPAILGSIMNNEYASPRHRVDAIRELRQTAIGTGPESTGPDDSGKFVITIVLSADEKLVFNKQIAPAASNNKEWGNSDDDAEQ
jgi:hypothetical protein